MAVYLLNDALLTPNVKDMNIMHSYDAYTKYILEIWKYNFYVEMLYFKTVLLLFKTDHSYLPWSKIGPFEFVCWRCIFIIMVRNHNSATLLALNLKMKKNNLLLCILLGECNNRYLTDHVRVLVCPLFRSVSLLRKCVDALVDVCEQYCGEGSYNGTCT